MKTFEYVLLIVTTCIGVVLGDLRIFGGTEVDQGNLNYAVYLEMPSSACTGALIHVKWVLTAAHCVTRKSAKTTYNPNEVSILAGTVSLDQTISSAQLRKARKIIVHEEYEPALGKPDLALITVNESFTLNTNVGLKGFSTVPWPQNKHQTWTGCIAAGWGMTEDGHVRNLKKLKTDAKHGRRACPCINRDYMLKRYVCLPGRPAEGVCFGDSGGALVCGNKIVGVAHMILDKRSCSYSKSPDKRPNCASPYVYGIYIYTCPFLDWIKGYVPGVPGTPESCTGTLTASPAGTNIMYALGSLYALYNCLTYI